MQEPGNTAWLSAQLLPHRENRRSQRPTATPRPSGPGAGSRGGQRRHLSPGTFQEGLAEPGEEGEQLLCVCVPGKSRDSGRRCTQAWCGWCAAWRRRERGHLGGAGVWTDKDSNHRVCPAWATSFQCPSLPWCSSLQRHGGIHSGQVCFAEPGGVPPAQRGHDRYPRKPWHLPHEHPGTSHTSQAGLATVKRGQTAVVVGGVREGRNPKGAPGTSLGDQTGLQPWLLHSVGQKHAGIAR